MARVPRLLDANANRAREAMRVMEDAARFMLDDRVLAGDLKTLRHDLAKAVARLPELPPHRDAAGDVGATLTTDSEQSRASPAHVALASGKRLSEALRALEEYAKTLPPEATKPAPAPGASGEAGAAPAWAQVERLRYRGYDLERRLNLMLRPFAPRQWRLCVLLTASLCRPHPWPRVLDIALDHGADCIQVREKDMGDRALLDHLAEVLERVAGRASVILNDRVDLALLGGAHGVHLGQGDLSPQRARQLAGGQLIVGVSTSHLAQARDAAGAGADYCGVGPMFPTTTVDDKPDIAGPGYLRQYLAHMRLPHLAIGGITPENLSAVTGAGARGIAVSSALCAAPDPAAACRALLAALPPAPQAEQAALSRGDG